MGSCAPVTWLRMNAKLQKNMSAVRRSSSRAQRSSRGELGRLQAADTEQMPSASMAPGMISTQGSESQMKAVKARRSSRSRARPTRATVQIPLSPSGVEVRAGRRRRQ